MLKVGRAGGGTGGVPTQPAPPGPPPTGVQPPVGPFTTLTTEQFFRNGSGLLTEKLFIDFTPTSGANTAGIGNMRWPYA